MLAGTITFSCSFLWHSPARVARVGVSPQASCMQKQTDLWASAELLRCALLMHRRRHCHQGVCCSNIPTHIACLLQAFAVDHDPLVGVTIVTPPCTPSRGSSCQKLDTGWVLCAQTDKDDAVMASSHEVLVSAGPSARRQQSRLTCQLLKVPSSYHLPPTGSVDKEEAGWLPVRALKHTVVCLPIKVPQVEGLVATLAIHSWLRMWQLANHPLPAAAGCLQSFSAQAAAHVAPQS